MIKYCLNYCHTFAKERYEQFFILYFIDTKTRFVNGLNSLQINKNEESKG